MLKNYWKRKDGNVAMIFALAAIPLLMGIGVAIDSSRLTAAHKRLQDAADTAALGAALKYKEEGWREMRAEGKALFETNAANTEGVVVSEIKTRKTQNNTVRIKSEASLDPMFMQIFGYPKMDISVKSEASLGSTLGMEIAIAFDSTNSMDFDSRWNNAMSAIQLTLTDMKRLTGKKNFYVSLVPFSDRVNIGTENADWLDGAPPAGWTGCVEPREKAQGGFAWSVDDKNPATESFTASISGVTGGLSSLACPNVAITGPTKKPKEIIDATKDMTHGGTGRFDTGMAWAWRLLSPKWRGHWDVSNYPADTSQPRRKKVIFVSDGNSNAYRDEMSAEDDWGHNQGSKVAFEHLVDLCSRMKNDGIEIYMMKIDGNPHADTYFQQCATSPSHYYKVTEAGELTVAFDDIVEGLQAELRIVR